MFPQILALTLAMALAAAIAQGPPPSADVVVDATIRDAVIDRALKALNDSYVYPDVATKMDAAIRARQARKEYDTVTSGRRFAQLLTEHLRDVSHDLHLSVEMIGGPPPPPPPPGGAPSAGIAQTVEERQRAIAGRQNFGFFRVERLAGNIGYVDLRGFVSPAMSGPTATAAMTFLANTDAVIFDLRQNGGGDPNMVAFLTSYLFGAQPVHLNDFYNRPTNETRQSWTLPFVPGPRLTDIDVYVLTSSRTFSGAEEFSYNLKHLKRATIVGETTGGGAHPVSGQRIHEHFVIAVPTGRPINAVTHSNWEGVGVEPDIKVPAEHALRAAHLIALEKEQRRLTSDMPGLRNEVATTIPVLRSELGALARTVTSDTDTSIAASSADDDFESGSLDGWRVDQRGSGGWFVYTDGRVPPNPARTDAAFAFDVPMPPQGKRAAITDQNGPGRFILYRDVRLDANYRLHLSMFYVNAGRFSGATITNRNTISDEQQYRIDIVNPSAPVDSVVPEHVLAIVFQAKPDDPARKPPTELIVDLSKWAGQTVRLRVAVGENQAPLRAGIDNVRFEKLP